MGGFYLHTFIISHPRSASTPIAKGLSQYKIGFTAGAENKQVCDKFNDTKDVTICQSGQNDGFNSNLKQWQQTFYWKHGFQLGREEKGEDSVGACNMYSGGEESLCIAGYDYANR